MSKRTSIKPYPYLVGKQCLFYFFFFFWRGGAVGLFSSGQIASGSGRESLGSQIWNTIHVHAFKESASKEKARASSARERKEMFVFLK